MVTRSGTCQTYRPTLILILILSVAGLAQTKLPKWFDVSYNKFEDQTTISFVEYGQMIYMVSGAYPGETLERELDDFYITFTRQDCYGFCFKGDVNLTLLIDGKRVVAGERESVLNDSISFTVHRDLIKQIAAAKLVEYKVGIFEKKWEPKSLAKFKLLLDLSTVKSPDK